MLFYPWTNSVTVKTIKLISGSSPFCETFFDNAVAKREDLIGELNKGWTVGKRLLQYERNATTKAKPKKDSKTKPKTTEIECLCGDRKEIFRARQGGRIADSAKRDSVICQVMAERALGLTTKRVVEESKMSGAPRAATDLQAGWILNSQSRVRAEVTIKRNGRSGLG